VSAVALASLSALLALGGCSTELNVSPPDEPIVTPSLPDAGFATPTVEPTGILAALISGEVLVEAPAGWGEPEISPRVDEGYVLQDVTWFLDGSAEGDFVTAAGMTPGQAEALSGGATFDAHVDGLAQVLAFDDGEPAVVTRSEVGGVPAARIGATSPEGMQIILWLYDLDEAIYELGFYGAPGGAADAERVAEFDAVAQTFMVPADT
jgi:hypothetical protein